MSDGFEYRCVACLDATISRPFDVSHLSRTCEECGEFDRFINTVVIEQFDALEADPPADLPWAELDRTRKFLIAERLSRKGHSIDDFEVAVTDDEGEAA